jgi:hypothetical protein
MTEYVREWEERRRALVNEVLLSIEHALQPFANNLDAFLAELFSARLPSDWRERWYAFVAEQAELGFLVEPESVDELETWIEQWARFCGLLPEKAVAMCVNMSSFEKDSSHHKLENVPNRFAQAGDTSVQLSHLYPAIREDLGDEIQFVSASHPKRRIPRTDGRWEGTPGESIWRPKKPLVLTNGDVIDGVPYKKGMPVFNKWSIGEVRIAITGENGFDQGQSLRDWHANGGGSVPRGYVFHHDGLDIQTIKYKGETASVGRMQLIPAELNGKIPHIGSASRARVAAPADRALARMLANEINESVLVGKGPLARIRKRFKSTLARRAKRIGRLLPIVGGVLVVLDFTENAKAHGVGGAIIRGTPLLGDLVAAYDVGSDLADQIKSQAEADAEKRLDELNRHAREAQREAARLTADAFRELAGRVRVTNPYFAGGSIQLPLAEFYNTVQPLVFLKLEGQSISYPEDMADSDRRLVPAFDARLRAAREILERTIRADAEAPPSGGPIY